MGHQNMKIKELVWSKELTDKKSHFFGRGFNMKEIHTTDGEAKKKWQHWRKSTSRTRGKLLHLSAAYTHTAVEKGGEKEKESACVVAIT